MAAELLLPTARATDANANPYSGAKWSFFESGTDSPQAVYADAALTTSLGSVVTADSAGKFVPIYFDASLTYRGVLKNSDGSVTLHDIDPINIGMYGALFAEGGSGLVGFLQAGSGAVPRTVEARLQDTMFISDFLPSGFVTAGGVNYTTHLQTAMQRAVDLGRALYGIDGIFDVSGAGLLVPSGLQFRGSGQDTCIIRNPNGNVLRLNGSRYDFSDVYFLGAGGHVVLQAGDVTRSQFRRVGFHQGSTSYSQWDNAGHMFITNLFDTCYFQHLEAATAPGFDLVGAGGTINNSRWENCWAQESGNYVVRVDSDDANAQYGNVFRGFIFEVCSGGGIQLKGNKGFVIDDCTNWDVDAGTAGEVKKDFYSILVGTGGATSYGRISNCERLAGPLDTGIYDVRLPGAGGGAGIIIDNCSTPGGGDPFMIEDAGNFIYTILPNTLSQMVNGANATKFDPLSGTLNMPGSISIDGFKVLDSRGAAVADAAAATYAAPAGGATVDAEARAALAQLAADVASVRTSNNTWLARARATTGHGLISG